MVLCCCWLRGSDLDDMMRVPHAPPQLFQRCMGSLAPDSTCGWSDNYLIRRGDKGATNSRNRNPYVNARVYVCARAAQHQGEASDVQ